MTNANNACLQFEGRDYSIASVEPGKQYAVDSVTDLSCLSGLRLISEALDLTPFINLKTLVLRSNLLKSMLDIGLGALKVGRNITTPSLQTKLTPFWLKELRLLDLRNNKIMNDQKSVGELLNDLQNLKVVHLRGNPFMRTAADRGAIIASIDRCKEVECECRDVRDTGSDDAK